MKLRLRAAWNVLRGKPTMYRISLLDGRVQASRGLLVCEGISKTSVVTLRHYEFRIDSRGA